MDRENLINSFLKNSISENFTREKIKGDASFRKYERIICEGKNYILMDAPPEKEDVKPFINICKTLINLGFSAPNIFNEDIQNGFLLLEDFGDNKFSTILINNINQEEKLYKNAVDCLIELYKKTASQKFSIAEYGKTKLLEEANLFTNWFIPYFFKPSESELNSIKKAYEEIILEAISKLNYPNNCLVLRDYHADNLIDLPERKTFQNVGLLDFQDALVGNPAYDLASLLEDARRDVSINIQHKMFDYFVEKLALDKAKFMQDYQIIAMQRNLKILGIFTRLKVRDGKENYLQFIPRVKNYLMQDLQNKSLENAKNFITKFI
ncbi:MAG: phosphotransferase [Rickettsiales bacterium]|nr:phosphotransferase [Rickettsiales bacterium]